MSLWQYLDEGHGFRCSPTETLKGLFWNEVAHVADSAFVEDRAVSGKVGTERAGAWFSSHFGKQIGLLRISDLSG